MSKITKRLFKYFAALLLFFAATAFVGFSLSLFYQTYRSHERGLKERAETIAGRLEQFMQDRGPKQGRGAYLQFVGDIAMADTYIVDIDGNPFSYGHRSAASGEPTAEVQEFARRIFESGNYEHLQKKDLHGRMVFYAGMPVYADGRMAAAVIICDTADMEQGSFVSAVSILGGCLAAALIVSGILSVVLSRRFVMPIRQIAHTAKELAGGNYQAATNVHDPTELGELAGEMDQLAQKLESARLESMRLEQAQQDYISNISHELRTPVTVIRSSLEAVCDGVVTGEKALEYQRQMLAESISLQRLVNDMLELSRLQNKDFPIEKAEMDILLALGDAVRAVRVLAKDKSVRILYEKNTEEWLMQGDYGRLRQMFVAALDNAVKYSPEESMVVIKIHRDAQSAVISIKDQGCGIPAEDLQNIFTRFFRSKQNAGQKHEKGSGLGLAIIKNIGDRHGIEISMYSDYGKGTEIVFRIPAAAMINV